MSVIRNAQFKKLRHDFPSARLSIQARARQKKCLAQLPRRWWLIVMNKLDDFNQIKRGRLRPSDPSGSPLRTSRRPGRALPAAPRAGARLIPAVTGAWNRTGNRRRSPRRRPGRSLPPRRSAGPGGCSPAPRASRARSRGPARFVRRPRGARGRSLGRDFTDHVAGGTFLRAQHISFR